MENGPFSAGGFERFAERVVLFCHITSGVATDPHPDLMREKGGQGFPSLAYLDEEGIVRGRPPDRDVEGLVSGLQMALRLYELDSKGEADNGYERFELRAALGMLDLEAAREEAARLDDLDEQQRRQVSAVVLRLEIDALIREHGQLRAGRAMLELKNAGRIPEPDTREAFDFWLNIISFARDKEDADLFEEALEGLEKAVGDDPTHRKMLDHMAEVLRKLKQGRE